MLRKLLSVATALIIVTGCSVTIPNGMNSTTGSTVTPNDTSIPGTDGTTDGTTSGTTGGTSSTEDADGDGYAAKDAHGNVIDCNDHDASIHPGATDDTCDGIDENCDGADGTLLRSANGSSCGSNEQDADGDGFMNVNAAGDTVDCNDSEASINPAAPELCGDGIDNNCDGNIDEGCAVDTGTSDTGGNDTGVVLVDADGDGFYTVPVDGKEADCNDGDASIHPGATDVPYDGIDQDCCDGDNVDVDGDGVTAVAAGGTDCDDNNAAVNPLPGTLEVCGDGIDNNCDGQIDEGCPVDTGTPADTGTTDTGTPVDTGTVPAVFDGTVELCFTNVDGAVSSMDIYAFNENTWDGDHWFGGVSGAVGTLIGGDQCFPYVGGASVVSEGDVIKVNGQQGASTYLVYGSAMSTRADLTANGHACTAVSNGAGGGDYECTAEAP